MKKETSSWSCLPFVIICEHLSKGLDEKISRSFGIRWCELARAQQKNKHDLEEVFFPLVRKGNSKKPLSSWVLSTG